MRISDWSSDVCSSDLLAAVDDPRDDFVHVIGRAHVLRDDAVEIFGIIFGRARVLHCRLEPVFDAEGRNDVADDRQGMFVILGKMVDDARFPGMQVAAAEILRSEEHTSELQSLMRLSYAVFCLKK